MNPILFHVVLFLVGVPVTAAVYYFVAMLIDGRSGGGMSRDEFRAEIADLKAKMFGGEQR